MLFSQLAQSWNALTDTQKSKRFLWAVAGIVAALFLSNGWRFFIGGDYTLSIPGACDPRTESCFVQITESCDVTMEDCASDAAPEKTYYTKVWRRVHSIAKCNPDEESCREQFSCRPGEEAICETEYCDPTIELVEGADRCSDASDVAELEAAESAEGEETPSSDSTEIDQSSDSNNRVDSTAQEILPSETVQ